MTVLKGVFSTLDKEAVRLISSMPVWILAEKVGKKMKMMHVLPVNFRLDSIAFPVGERETKNRK